MSKRYVDLFFKLFENKNKFYLAMAIIFIPIAIIVFQVWGKNYYSYHNRKHYILKNY